MLPWQPINFSDLDKIHMNRRGLLKKHFCKKNLNICSETAKIINFHFSHNKSMATISCHSNQSSYPIETKNIIICSHGIWMLYVKFGKNRLHGFRRDVVWKCWRTTDGRRMPAYTISSPMSLRLRWAKNLFEPPHDKTNKMVYMHPAKTQINLGILAAQSDQSLRCPHEESLGP